MITELIEIARSAGEIILNHYDGCSVTVKEDRSPLTTADNESNEFIVRRLKLLDAPVPVISEEEKPPDYEHRKRWSKFWLVDPLDGTKEFLAKNGEFTVNIALIENGIPSVGVIYAPAKKLLYYADPARGSWRQEGDQNPVRIYSRPPDINDPLVIIESRSHKTEESLDLRAFKIKQRLSVGSSLKFCFLAEGKADLYPRSVPTMEWDVAAGDCIFRNSGIGEARKSPFMYNKPSLKNGSFLLGL